MRKPPSILHIVGDSKFGGGFRYIVSLVNMARMHGLEAEVLATDPIVVAELERCDIKPVVLPVIWRNHNPIRDIVGLIRLVHFLRNAPYLIVHTHTSKGGFIGRLGAKLANVPIIVHTVHGFAFHEFSNAVTLKFYSSLERLAAHWCDRIITVSNFHREWALRLGISSPEKIVAIPNGISPEYLKPSRSRVEMQRELGLNPDDKIIVTLGRLFPQKGLEYLIRALPKVIEQIGTVTLIIVGEGPLRASLERLTQSLGITTHVKFLGFRKDIANILNLADVVALPSLWEGLSIALLEAMAMAKPIVTTDIGSNREVIEHGKTGLLVPPADPGSLAEGIVFLISNPSISAQLGTAAREAFEARFTEERMLRDTWQVYYELICRKLPYVEIS
jgi:glycosyltransferase involved in cell wall biosynthesis